jgi:hypothetical protein
VVEVASAGTIEERNQQGIANLKSDRQVKGAIDDLVILAKAAHKCDSFGAEA